jgi:hypothetical protein
MVVLRLALLVVCAALLTSAVAATYRAYASGGAQFIDWVTYAHATERLFAGQSLYAPEQLAGPYQLPDVLRTGYAYPPPSAVLFAPFSFGDAGLFAWLVLNVALLLSGLVAVLRRELGSIQPVALGLVLVGLSVPLPRGDGTIAVPFADGVVTANANVALAGMVAWAWALADRDRWLPFAAAVGGIVKVFPAGLAFWSARRHGWRPLLITAVVGAALVVVTLPLTGINEWVAFTRALGNAVPACSGRLSVACVLGPMVGQTAATWIGIGLGATLLLGSLVVRNEVAAFTLLVLGMLAPVTDGHPHYFLFIDVLLVVAAARFVGRRRSRLGPGVPTA